MSCLVFRSMLLLSRVRKSAPFSEKCGQKGQNRHSGRHPLPLYAERDRNGWTGSVGRKGQETGMVALPDGYRSGESGTGRKKIKLRPCLTPCLGPHRSSGCMKAARSMTAPCRKPGRDGFFFFCSTGIRSLGRKLTASCFPSRRGMTFLRSACSPVPPFHVLAENS